MEFRQAVAETGPFGRRRPSILPCSPFPLPLSADFSAIEGVKLSGGSAQH